MVNDLPDQYSKENNPVDNYDFNLQVTPVQLSWALRGFSVITLPIGILRRVQIDFPKGCNNRIRVNIYHGVTQIIPIDATGVPGASYHSFNGFMLDFNTFRVITAATTAFTINGWNDSTVASPINWNHDISVTFYVERVAVP
jgi:hypothetical protein